LSVSLPRGIADDMIPPGPLTKVAGRAQPVVADETHDLRGRGALLHRRLGRQIEKFDHGEGRNLS
jgi:hypothetical protein